MGIASSVGIVFTFLIFGLFLPAAKLEVDQLRDHFGVPEFGSTPIASEDSSFGRLLSVPAIASQRAPVFSSSSSCWWASARRVRRRCRHHVRRGRLPAAGRTAGLRRPRAGTVRPGEYTITGTINLLEDRFATNQDESVTIYVEGSLEKITRWKRSRRRTTIHRVAWQSVTADRRRPRASSR